MRTLRIVAVKEDFFIDNELYSVENELMPNIGNGHNRPYVIVIKLKFREETQNFAIPFRSNIAGHRDKFEYFALPPRKETKSHNIHGLHFIKMFPVDKSYLLKYNYPDNNANAALIKQYIQKNFSRLVNEAQNYIDKFEAGSRPKCCIDIGKIYDAIHKNNISEKVKMEIIVAASQNRGKIKELEAITKEFGMKIISRDEAGVDNIEIIEDGKTFEENSLKKAREIMKLCGKITIADDSGIEVDAINGEPGVFSARYAGEEADDQKNRDKLLKELEGVPLEKRTARFVAVISMVYPDGKEIAARGECAGHVIFEERGMHGFGYDSLFVPLGYEKTFAELSPEEKNKISHRANALNLLKNKLGE